MINLQAFRPAQANTCVFFGENCDIFKDTYFNEHQPTAASVVSLSMILKKYLLTGKDLVSGSYYLTLGSVKIFLMPPLRAAL